METQLSFDFDKEFERQNRKRFELPSDSAPYWALLASLLIVFFPAALAYLIMDPTGPAEKLIACGAAALCSWVTARMVLAVIEEHREQLRPSDPASQLRRAIHEAQLDDDTRREDGDAEGTPQRG
jgi:hypothetical protein